MQAAHLERPHPSNKTRLLLPLGKAASDCHDGKYCTLERAKCGSRTGPIPAPRDDAMRCDAAPALAALEAYCITAKEAELSGTVFLAWVSVTIAFVLFFLLRFFVTGCLKDFRLLM